MSTSQVEDREAHRPVLQLRMRVNDESVQLRCEPRTSLADALRKDLGLTGTHLSCEHGVCGACTVLIDGTPQRSCITLAASCDGARVTTIEGYADDAVMADLRQAFHTQHALQCGYCTPGMLCTARDIVLRLPGPDSERVRNELAGNICRCTGYVGIVNAIQLVLQHKQDGALPMPQSTTGLTSNPGLAQQASSEMQDWPSFAFDGVEQWLRVDRELDFAIPAQALWQRVADLALVARCLPGASISQLVGSRAIGEMQIRFGPMQAQFAMRAELSLQPALQQGEMRAEGSDRRSGTLVQTQMSYQVLSHATGSRLRYDLRFRLAGPLAQFSRNALVNDYVSEMSRIFGQNLQRADSAEAVSQLPAETPSLWRIVWRRVTRWLQG
jgi:carbon-monoxide dehydrogenase small subunit